MPSTSAIDPILGGDLTEDGRDVDKSDMQTALQAAKDELDAIFGYAEPNVTTVDPTASNDNTEGYVIGSRWINTSTPSIWECTDASTGAAMWSRIDLGAATGGLDPVDDTTASISIGTITDGTWRRCTNASPIATALAACPVGVHVRLERAGTNPITVNWQAGQQSPAGAGAKYFTADDHSGTPSSASFTVKDWVVFLCVANSDGDSALFEIEASGSSLPTQSDAAHDFAGNNVSGNAMPPISRGTGSEQPDATTDDRGKYITSDGPMTIPNKVGWHCTWEVGAITHDLTHNGLTLDISATATPFAAGELYWIYSKSSTEVRVAGPSGQYTEADFVP